MVTRIGLIAPREPFDFLRLGRCGPARIVFARYAAPPAAVTSDICDQSIMQEMSDDRGIYHIFMEARGFSWTRIAGKRSNCPKKLCSVLLVLMDIFVGDVGIHADIQYYSANRLCICRMMYRD